MATIIDNWYLILAAIAVGACAAIFAYRFFCLPRSEQLEKVKEWLLLACTKAEAELGSGTGKLKLPYVYDMFLSKFPWLSKIISFASFSKMVDDALPNMRKMLEDNAAAKAIVDNTGVTLNGI